MKALRRPVGQGAGVEMGLGGTLRCGLGRAESIFAIVYVPDWVAKKSSLAPIIAIYVTRGVGLSESALEHCLCDQRGGSANRR